MIPTLILEDRILLVYFCNTSFQLYSKMQTEYAELPTLMIGKSDRVEASISGE